MEPDEYFKGLLERTGLPKWVVGGSVGIVAAAVGYVALSKLLEEAFALERPASPFVAASLILAVYWLVLVHTLRQRPLWIIGALCVLLAAAIYAVFKLWILYHTSPLETEIPLRVPFLAASFASVIAFLAINAVLKSVDRPADAWVARWIAAATGAVLFAGAAVLVFFRPGELDFVADTIFADEAPEGSLKILLAPYNRDPDDDARSRMRGDLDPTVGLLARDPELAKEISLVSLRRPIPGFEDGRDKQREIAQKIALYDGARMLIYGDVEGKYQSNLVRTNFALVRPSQYLRDALSIPQLVERPVTNDAASVHYFAAIIATASSLIAQRCATAERLADEAAAALHGVPQNPDDPAQTPGTSVLSLLKAGGIACEVTSHTATPEKLSAALTLLDGVLRDPASSTDLRLQAAATKGLIQSNATNEPDAAMRQSLQSAIETYASALRQVPQDADEFYVANVWNGLGVARDKLQRTIDPSDKPARLAMLASALEAYEMAGKAIDKASKASTGATPGDVAYLRARIEKN